MDDHNALLAERHTIFQSSLMTALLDGIYDGEISIGELLGHGNFGIGTFDALDGEMVILDGVCYQLRGDGSASEAALTQRSPFAIATNFVPRLKARVPRGMHRSELSDFITSLLPSENYMYAVRISGMFSSVSVRTVTKQERPYRPMTQATGDDAELEFTNVSGVVAGFRTPSMKKASAYLAATSTSSTPTAPAAATSSTSPCLKAPSKSAQEPTSSCACRSPKTSAKHPWRQTTSTHKSTQPK